MFKKLAVIVPVCFLMILMVQEMGMTKRIFDTELSFNPVAGQGYHYAQQVVLRGTEISFQRVEQFGGMIQAIYDETCTGNSNGLISNSLQFQTYEVLNETSGVWDEQPFGGPFGPGRGPYSNAPMPNKPEGPGAVQPSPDQPKPEQDGGGGGGTGPGGGGGGTGPGGGGSGGGAGGGSEWGGQQRRQEDTAFRITPILETQLNYTIGQDGRLLDMQGLDLIGDFYDPQNQISVRQIFQSSHFLTLPNYQVHVGESWKGSLFWTVPFVGETRKIDMQFTLQEITIQERYKLANIAFYGIDQFDTVTTQEKWDDEFSSDVRIDSDLHCDIMINGNLLFDIDRGVVVAIGDDIRSKQWIPYVNPNSFPIPWGNNMLLSTIVVDRTDTRTPLGNVLDNEPRKDHIVQDMVWRTWLMLE